MSGTLISILVPIFIVFLFAALIFAIYLYLIHPNTTRREEAKAFCSHGFAHRGLHTSAPENTLPAFRLEHDVGYGIELDIRLSKDGEVVVFHDDTLIRAAGIDKRVEDLTYDELTSYGLFGSDEKIPRLADALHAADGAPLLVEIKATYDCEALCEKTAEILSCYTGEFAIESFSPIAIRWFAKNRPEFLRGQLSSGFSSGEASDISFIERFAITNILLNFYAKPDFVAYDLRDVDNLSLRLCQKIFDVPTIYWTVKSFDSDGNLRDACILEGCIFE